MKLFIPLILFYSLLTFGGGIFGFIKANSLPSLIMGTLSGTALFITCLRYVKGKKNSLYIIFSLSLLLTFFFGYRWTLRPQLFPSGAMAFLSLIATLSTIIKIAEKRRCQE